MRIRLNEATDIVGKLSPKAIAMRFQRTKYGQVSNNGSFYLIYENDGTMALRADYNMAKLMLIVTITCTSLGTVVTERVCKAKVNYGDIQSAVEQVCEILKKMISEGFDEANTLVKRNNAFSILIDSENCLRIVLDTMENTFNRTV